MQTVQNAQIAKAIDSLKFAASTFTGEGESATKDTELLNLASLSLYAVMREDVDQETAESYVGLIDRCRVLVSAAWEYESTFSVSYLQAQIARLQAENQSLKAKAQKGKPVRRASKGEGVLHRVGPFAPPAVGIVESPKTAQIAESQA